ncbi:MAG: alpha/beta hydrolase-fold protein [Bacteroidota bacterium]|nr:alpha/beta hydrolase-fold protein [Bacteroidota bacterium]
MKQLFLFLGLVTVFAADAQFTVRLVVTDVATRKQDDIYVTGNFNNWNPKDENYKLKPFAGNRKSLVIKNLAAGTYAFKFSRGANDRLETTADGRDISDRVLEVTEDVSQEFTIAGWKDDYPEVPKKYTASPQVRIMDTAFLMPQLNRKRRIWVYLPKGYATSPKLYPVLYMQDGQNLFNEKTAAFGEWGVDECLDSLQQKTGKECIVVGIDNGGENRLREYNPYDHSQFGKGEGKAYAEFLAQTLKPYIDTKYRTKKGPENTFVAGSSMGALISLYAMIQYPSVFGAAGIFSPSFSQAPPIYADAEKFTSPGQPRFYLYAGGKESPTLAAELQKMADILQKKQRFVIRKVVSPLGQHNETYWRQEFAAFYQWLMSY